MDPLVRLLGEVLDARRTLDGWWDGTKATQALATCLEGVLKAFPVELVGVENLLDQIALAKDLLEKNYQGVGVIHEGLRIALNQLRETILDEVGRRARENALKVAVQR